MNFPRGVILAQSAWAGLRTIVAQYNIKSLELLEAKIAQFPRGAKFSLTSTSPQNQDQNRLEDEVQAAFERNGMILLPADVPPLF
jgi:hypothetical protein